MAEYSNYFKLAKFSNPIKSLIVDQFKVKKLLKK